MKKYKLKHKESGEIKEFINKSAFEYCKTSDSWEECIAIINTKKIKLDNYEDDYSVKEAEKEYKEEKEYKKIDFKKSKKGN